MATGVNFIRWMNNLGLKRDDAPEYVHAVQPTSIARDETELVSPAPGVRGFGGVLAIAGAGVTGFRLSPTRGWKLVAFNVDASENLFAANVLTKSAQNAETAVTVASEDPTRPATALLDTVDFTAVPTGSSLIGFGDNNGQAWHEVWVPANYHLEVAEQAISGTWPFAVRWIEYPADGVR